MHLSLVLPLLWFSLVFSLRHSFTLEYRGICATVSPRYDCSASAQSETISSVIQPHGNPETSVRRAIGAISLWLANGTIAADNTKREKGTVSFGIHSTHESHTLSYEGTGVVKPTGCSTMWIDITGGSGTLTGATGSLATASCIEDDGVTFVAWLSGFILLDD